MSLPLKIVKKRDPRDVTKPTKFYVSTKSTGEVTFEELALQSAGQCTVKEADCYAVIKALEHNVKDALSQGKIVRFGTIGSFQISISSHGAATKKELGIKSVKQKRVLFRPDKRLKNLLSSLKFTKEEGFNK